MRDGTHAFCEERTRRRTRGARETKASAPRSPSRCACASISHNARAFEKKNSIPREIYKKKLTERTSRRFQTSLRSHRRNKSFFQCSLFFKKAELTLASKNKRRKTCFSRWQGTCLGIDVGTHGKLVQRVVFVRNRIPTWKSWLFFRRYDWKETNLFVGSHK